MPLGCADAPVANIPPCGGCTLNQERKSHVDAPDIKGILSTVWQEHQNINSWAAMMDRCYNGKNPAYRNYGGRGITVCTQWHNFQSFYGDMDTRDKGMTLDRVNNEGNYTPGNCRWATRHEQSRNSRQNKPFYARSPSGRWYKANVLKDFARQYGISENGLRNVLKKKNKKTAQDWRAWYM